MKLLVPIFLLWFLAFDPSWAGHEQEKTCDRMRYEDKNQVDYGPLRMAVVRGEAADAQSVPVPQVCVGIFTDVDHKLIASTETDESGGFHFDGIPGGSYRLVASYDGFSVANAKVRVEPKVNQKKRLALHMRFAGIDSTSFFELK